MEVLLVIFIAALLFSAFDFSLTIIALQNFPKTAVMVVVVLVVVVVVVPSCIFTTPAGPFRLKFLDVGKSLAGLG